MRALIYLAEHRGRGPVTLHEISDELQIPKAFLSKILQQLSRNSIVKSLKGPSGGFALARDPVELSISEIVTEIDGPLHVFTCFSSGSEQCTYHGNCKILSVFDAVGTEVEKVLQRYHLSDFVNDGLPAAQPVAKVSSMTSKA